MPAGAGELGVVTLNHPSLVDQRTPLNNSVTPEKMPASHKGIIICTSTTRPAAPVAVGQPIYETDTGNYARNTGTTAAPVWSYSTRRVPIDATTRNLPWNYTTDLVTPEYLSRMNAIGYFYARRSADVNNSATYTYLLAPLNEEIDDTHGWYNPSTYRYSPGISGLYLFAVTWYLEPTSWGYYDLAVRKYATDGSSQRFGYFYASAVGAAPGKSTSYGLDTISASPIIQIAAGESVDFTWYVGQTTKMLSGSGVEGWRIGDKP